MTLTDALEAVEVVDLWPDGPPTTIPGVPAESAAVAPGGIAKGSTVVRNISHPTLSVFTPAPGTSNGIGVIVAPGGGWTVNMWTHEGVDVARWLTGIGCTAFVLKYRVQASDPDQRAFEARQASTDGVLAAPRAAAHLPRAIADLVSTDAYLAARAAALDDGRRAVAIARDLASRYDVRPETIGMIGFSAGAFLAVDVAMDPAGAAPLAFIAPIYGGETLGRPVPVDAPPLFAAVARDDILYKVCEGTYLAWSDADRPAELHVYARGQHGFALVEQGLPSDRWTNAFAAWLLDVVG